MRGSVAVYGLTLAAVAAAAAVRGLFDPLVGNQLPWVTFVLPVALASWLGGVRPALLATVLGYLAGLYLFVPPPYAFGLIPPGRWPYALVTYFIVCLTLAWFGEAMRDARRRATARSRLLEATLASITDGIITTDAVGRVTFQNGLAAELTGWSPEAALGRPLAEVFRVADGRCPAQEALRLGKPVAVPADALLIARNGTERWIEGSAAPVRDDDGAVAGVVLAFRDVTDKRRALAAAAARERQFEALVENIPDVVSRLDRQARHLYVSPSVERASGLPPAAFLGKTNRDLGMPDWFCNLVEGAVAGVFATGREARNEFTFPGPEGERHYESVLIPEYGPDGAVATVLGLVRDVTELKHALAAARESEARYRQAVESISDAFARLDRDWRYVYVNARTSEISGMSAEDMLGKTVWELFPAVLGTEMETRCRRVVACGRAERFEYYYPPFGRWFEQRLYPSEAGLTIFSADVTDRKRAEELARESEERFAAAFRASPEGLAISRVADGTLHEVNESWLRVFGYDRAEALGRTSLELNLYADPADRERARAALAADGRLRDCELTVRHRSGELRTVVVAVEPIELGGEPCLLSIVRDVTDRRRTEERMAQSEARFRHLAEAMPQIVWTAAPDGTITYINGHWTGYTGLSLEETNRLEVVRSAIHPDDAERVFRLWADALATGRPHEAQWRFRRRADGAYRWFLTRAVAVRDGNGQVREWFGTATDIDEQKRAEDALVAADRRKDDFLATLAHELRNPLAPLRNGLHLLRLADRDPAIAQEARGMMERQLAHMVRLIDDLLDVSRITRGKLQLRRERVDLTAVVQSAVEASRPLIEASRHQLTVTLPPESLTLDGDPTRLAQVLSNLLTNAAKYTDPGGRIRLTAERQGAEVVVTVQDTGIGIAPEHLAGLFEMFSQVKPALERSQGGLGIGLSIVRGLVEMHGGSVAVHSDGPGQGSAFSVRLPLALSPAEPAGMSPDRDSRPRPRRRVLVVDDNVDAADSLALMLRLVGDEVEVAHDGEQATRSAAAFRPDVILLDIGLPRMNGYDAARHIRGHAWGARIVLVALTGWGQEEDKRLAAEAGFDHHLTKPVDPEDLERLLAGLRERRVEERERHHGNADPLQ